MTTQPIYNHIPALRFPDFLNDGEWEDYSIEEVFDIRNGYTPSKSKTDYWENGTIPWFRMEDIRANGNILSDSIQHITQEAIKGFGLFPAYSIIVATSATIGEHALITVESLANQRFTYLSKKKPFENKVDMLYFHYYMFVIDEWCKKNTNTGGFLSVNMSAFRQLRIPLPPLVEQRRIAQTLTALDELIAATNGKLEQLKAYKKGLMQKLFPAKGKKQPELRFKEFEKDGEWEEKKLGEIVNVLDSQRKPVAKNERMRGKYPYYGANGIQDYVSDYIFDGSFLLMGEDGSVINKDGTPVLHWAEGRIWVNNHAHVMSENCNAAYLKYVFYVLSKVDVQSLVKGIPPKINQQNMRNILLLIPSLPEQVKIASCLSTLDEKINSYKEKIALLGQYKKGLMQQLFPTSK